MGIKLSILAHQTECLKRISKVFEGVNLTVSDDVWEITTNEKGEIIDTTVYK